MAIHLELQNRARLSKLVLTSEEYDFSLNECQAEVKLLLDPESVFSKWKTDKPNMHMSQNRGMVDILERVCHAHVLFKDCIPGMHSQDRSSSNPVDFYFLHSSRWATGCWPIFFFHRLPFTVQTTHSALNEMIVIF